MPAASGTTIYQEDFSTTTLTGQISPYLGGWYATAFEPVPVVSGAQQIGFGAWANANGVNITVGEALQTPSDSGFRGGAVALNPTLFVGAGEYKLTYDVDVDIPLNGSTGVATVNIWEGSGYDLTLMSPDAIQLNTESGQLDSHGSAVSSELASTTHSADGTSQELTFTYDGSSAVVLFFGATSSGFPFPTVEYDNISVEAVPEPHTGGLMAVCLGAAFLYRRRS